MKMLCDHAVSVQLNGMSRCTSMRQRIICPPRSSAVSLGYSPPDRNSESQELRVRFFTVVSFRSSFRVNANNSAYQRCVYFKHDVQISRGRRRGGYLRGSLVERAASSSGPGDPLRSSFRNLASSEDGDVHTRGTDDFSISSLPDLQSSPLKINQDILIFQATKLRNTARKTRKKEDRIKLRLSAIRVYERAKAIDPSDGRAYVGIGYVLRQMDDIIAARQCYQDGCDATGGDNAYIWQSWAMLEAAEGNVSKARQLFDAATAADKRHAAAWHAWGMFEKSLGNFQRARDLFLKGVRLVPASSANAHLFQSLGVMAMERGRIQEAREHFKEGTKTESGAQSAALWQAWAILESREGNSDQARKLFQRGLSVDPENRYVWLSWAVYEAQEGFIDRARGLLRKGRELNPSDPPLLQALARLEASEGNMTAARQLFEQGTKLDPLHQANWQAWALAEWRAGNVHRARQLLQRGVWVAPRCCDACKLFQAWGVLEEREGNVALARQLYKCGIKADPSSEATWLTWALMEERQGNDIRATELRNLCVQQRAEEAVGQSDLSPAAMFGIDSALRPVLRSISTLLGNQSTQTEDALSGNRSDADLSIPRREVVKAEPLYGVAWPEEK